MGVREGLGDSFVQIGGVKGFVDGSIGSSTAKMYEPYLNEPGSTGIYVTPLATLREWIRGADAAGLQVIVHAIGDRANAELLSIFAEVAQKNGARDRRFRIEHAQHLRRQDLAPGEHFVDMGYTSGEDLVTQADLGTQVIGPVGPTPGWQAQQHGGFAPADFALDWDAERATCPQGQHSVSWKQGQDGKRALIKIHFATATCRPCPVREQCTHSSRGRSLTILPKSAQQAREQRLREQGSPAFQQRYARRAGVEATISQAVRTKGLRRCRSRGLAKAHLHHVTIAAAINLVRLDTSLLQRQQGKPVRPVRPLSPFARLQERACA